MARKPRRSLRILLIMLIVALLYLLHFWRLREKLLETTETQSQEERIQP